jgi:MFS superfamily sulfate permease-like transporter
VGRNLEALIQSRSMPLDLRDRVLRQMEVLFLILILSTGTLLGNEFSIGAFIHPALSRDGSERFLPAIQVFARLFGKIMPFWMAATFLLHLVLLALTWRWPAPSTVLLFVATLLWLAIIVFSVAEPVPINNRVKAWDLQNLPPDWRQQRQRWDRLNAIRVVMIAIAFLALVGSYRTASSGIERNRATSIGIERETDRGQIAKSV